MSVVWHGLRDAFLMGWEVWWALVLGFLISAVVQAWVPRERIERSLAASGAAALGRATVLGAASSSCSYAAVAIAKSLFQKGASAASAIAFELASTNLVWELGLVLWVLIGWQFTLAEYLGGIVMVALVGLLFRRFVPRQLEDAARVNALRVTAGHVHRPAGSATSWRHRVRSLAAWSDVAHNFRGDWQMLGREIAVGFLLSGFIAQIGNHFLHGLFLTGSSSGLRTVWGAVVGPVIAVLSFMCSVGNVPLAAVLWSGGISFAGVIAFIFADLIVLPIVVIYRKYYGASFALRLSSLLFLAMVLAALLIDGLFAALGLIPGGHRPSRSAVFGTIAVDYKLVLNLIGVAVFGLLFALTARRGARDPVCGMTVDRAKAITLQVGSKSYFFCSEACRKSFAASPEGSLTRARVPV